MQQILLERMIDNMEGIWEETRQDSVLAQKWQAFGIRCARRALDAVGDPDPRSVALVEAIEQYANEEMPDEEFAAILEAARAAMEEAIQGVLPYPAYPDAAQSWARSLATQTAVAAAGPDAWDVAILETITAGWNARAKALRSHPQEYVDWEDENWDAAVTEVRGIQMKDLIRMLEPV